MMTTKTAQNSTLFIQGLELTVYLGWPTAERMEKQTVLLDIEIKFSKPPVACDTDDLKDTTCYASLIHYLREQLSDRKFHLLEHLTQEIHRLTQSQLIETDAKVYISITKYPHIPGLTRGVRFVYGEI